MVDFRELAAKARAEHERKLKEREVKAETDRTARSAEVDVAIAVLERHVVPLLERAKDDFHAEGVEARILKNFDVKKYAKIDPSLKFQCLGPARKSDGYRFEAPAAFFRSDGHTITVEWGEPATNLGSAKPGDSEPLVIEAIKKALASYIAELDRTALSRNLRP